MRRFSWGAALAAALLVTSAPAQDLGVAERFGPDGLPFSHDDPLAVGASASKVRYGAMAGDACSEDDTYGSHGHGGAHPTEGTNLEGNILNHTQRDTVGAYGTGGSAGTGLNFILDAPFDLTLWISGINLDNGRVGRFRIFPEDPDGWLADLDFSADERGWVDGWTSHTDPDLGALMDGGVTDADAGAGDRDMNNVFAGGAVKELHLETLGLSYRDIKPARTSDHELPIAVKQETLETMTEFWQKFENKVNELHLTCQQAYIEAWVTELMNLNTMEAGISGNFVLDMTGEQIIQRVDYSKSKAGCEVGFEDLPFDLGGPPEYISLNPSTGQPYESIVEYFMEQRWEYLWSYHFEDGWTCGIGDFLVGIEDTAKEKTVEKLEPMDLAASLMDTETLDDAGDGSHTNDDLNASSTLYEIIAAYSGLAGRGSKNVFDKFALSVMIFFAQFKPTEWGPWAHVDATDAMMGFEPPSGSLTTTQQTMSAATDFRYNNGSSYIGKAMWIYGNSSGKDSNGIGANIANSDQQKHRFGTGDADHTLNLGQTPDILSSYAMRWLHVRVDVVDPYIYSEDLMRASWKDRDILIDHTDDNGEVLVDWPPPNYGFGRAQVVSFRAASGGAPNTPTGQPADVTPNEVQIWQGLVSVDPLTRTYSLLGNLYQDNSGLLDFNAGDTKLNSSNFLTWSVPRALGPNGETPDIPTYLDDDPPYRWLTAGVNHWREANTELRWGWDFDTADTGDLDSGHVQQMADIQGAEHGAVFAVQTQADGGQKGRTGFSLVEHNLPLNP